MNLFTRNQCASSASMRGPGPSTPDDFISFWTACDSCITFRSRIMASDERKAIAKTNIRRDGDAPARGQTCEARWRYSRRFPRVHGSVYSSTTAIVCPFGKEKPTCGDGAWLG